MRHVHLIAGMHLVAAATVAANLAARPRRQETIEPAPDFAAPEQDDPDPRPRQQIRAERRAALKASKYSENTLRQIKRGQYKNGAWRIP
jgi:hypothetical protein